MRSETIKGIKDQSQFTVVVLGDAKTGKTAFVTQCILDKMKTTYKPTIEDCYTTLTRLPDGKYKTLDMIDTAGSMEFPAMRELRIRSATLIVMVYDVDNTASINKINALTKQVKQIREYDEVPIIVLGNLRSPASTTRPESLPLPALLAANGQDLEHFYLDVADQGKCKQVYERIIQRCYENSTWKVEVWAMSPRRRMTDSNIEKKKRGLFSYLSFRKSRRSKSSGQRQATTSNMSRSSKSIL